MLFESVRYVLASTLSEERRLELATALDRNEGRQVQSIEDETLTHVITNSPTFEGASKVRAGVSVVTDLWVDRAMHLGKLPPTSIYSPDPAMIFSGVVACSTGIPPADMEVLAAGIAALGGQWRNALTRDVTHLFALPATSQPEPQEAEDAPSILPEPNSAKYQTARHYQPQTHVKILLPHWFDDAVRLGMGSLPTQEYEWPSVNVLKPLHLRDAENAEGKDKEGKKVDRTPAAKRSILRSQIWDASNTNIPKPGTNVWKSRKILLSSTLGLSEERKTTIAAAIERAGGSLVEVASSDETPDHDDRESASVEEADVLITKWRAGKAYFKALKADKLIGSLSWLFHVHSGSTLSAPTDQLLHYPIPRRGIDGFMGHVISVTNYTGESREYLKRLIEAMGATFTASMTGNNTVLIAAFISGVKTTKATSWSIPIVNHTWLEDCFVRWRNLTVATEKYIVFPPGVDFAKMLGERSLGRLREIENTVLAQAVRAGEEVLDVVRNVGVASVGKGLEVDIWAGVDEDEGLDPEEKKLEISEEERVRFGIGSKARHQEVEQPTTPRKATKDSGTAPNTSPMKTPRNESAQNTPRPRKVVANKPNSAVPLPATATSAIDVLEISSALVPNDEDDDMNGVADVSIVGEEEFQPVASDGMDIDSPSGIDEAMAPPTSPSPKPSSSPPPRAPATEEEEEAEADADMAEEQESEALPPRKVPIPVKRVAAVTPKAPPSQSPLKSPAKSPAKSPKNPYFSPLRDRRIPGIDVSDDDDSDSLPDVSEILNIKKSPPRKPPPQEAQESEESEPEEVSAPAPRKKLTRRSGEGIDLSKLGPQLSPLKSQKKHSPNKPVVAEKEVPRLTMKSRMKPSLKKAPTAQSDDEPGTSAPPRRRNRANARQSSSKKLLSQGEDEDIEEDEEVDEVPILGAKGRRSKKKASAQLASSGDEAEASSVLSLDERAPVSSEIAVTNKAITPSSHRSRPSALTTPLTSPSKGKGKSSEATTAVEEQDEGIEVSAPSGRSKRRAAATATRRLREEVMPDVVNYQKQMSRARKSGNLPQLFTAEETKRGTPVERSSGKAKRKSDVDIDGEAEVNEGPSEAVITAGKSKKRRKGDVGQAVEVDVEPTSVSISAKSKRSAKTQTANVSPSKSTRQTPNVRLLTTQVTLPDSAIKRLTKLGVKFTTKPSECTHLIAPHLVRTEKFLCALAVNPFILTSTWATASAAAGELLPEDGYYLTDDVNEAKYKVKLSEALDRATENCGRLFVKQTFYVTPKVSIDFKLLKNVISANGGQMVTTSPTSRTLNNQDKHLISCPEDVSIWRPFSKGRPIYTTELVLHAALTQHVDWESDEFKVPGSF